VRKIGVHLDHHVVPTRHTDQETGPVRGSETGLRAAAQHLDATELHVEFLGAIGGVVGAAVVDDEDVGVGQRRARATQDVLDVLDLVVGRQQDEHAHGRRAYRRDGCSLLHGHTIGR
jgi:hypothetical protein